MNKAGAVFTRGIYRENPVFVRFAGLFAALAITTSVQNGAVMGLTVTATMLLTDVVIALLRRWIPEELWLIAHVTVAAAFATVFELLLRAYFPNMAVSPGIYVPLIAVSGVLLQRYSAPPSTVPLTALDALGTGLGFTLALIIVSCAREFLGAGTIWGARILPENLTMNIFTLPPGGFIALGVLAGLARLTAGKIAVITDHRKAVIDDADSVD